jgi:hypothetical protein
VATPREQFIEAVRGEIERLDTSAKRIAELLPTLSFQLQGQWKSAAKCRRSDAEQLRILLEMAEEEWRLGKSV